MSDDSVKHVRSPSYPSISLREAVEAVKSIERKYRAAAVDREAAAKLIGYTSLSGPATKVLAALASYGLAERAGKGELRVTARARAILHPENEEERRRGLLSAAREPDLFRELFDRFPDPHEEGIEIFLNRHNFNASAVKPATRAFIQTLSYLEEFGAAENQEPEVPTLTESESPRGSAHVSGGAKVGDLVQWESGGQLQFETPKRVRMVSDDGNWVAVEGSRTGIPMGEIIVETLGPQTTTPDFPLDDGEVEWIHNRLGLETHVRLLVKGPMGPKEIGKLIRLLEAQKAVLEDE